MERLTTRCAGHAVMAWEHEEQHTTQEWIDMLTDRLAYYEDLEEQGQLVVLPCRVGDTVYRKLTLTYQKETVTVIGIDNEGIYIGTTCGTYQKHHLGKTVFLTREEAEKALKEDA